MSDQLDLPKYLRVRAARATEDGDHLSQRIYSEAADEIERLSRLIQRIRMELNDPTASGAAEQICHIEAVIEEAVEAAKERK